MPMETWRSGVEPMTMETHSGADAPAGVRTQDSGRIQPSDDETLDAIGQGGLRLLQHRRGYRFCVDALLLADFARHCIGQGPFIDLGTGCGVVALATALQSRRTGTAVEIQDGLSEVARRNARLNGLGETVDVIHADFRALRQRLPPGAFQCVLSNPPFFSLERGRVNPEGERAVARHEVKGCLADVAEASRWLLKDGGSLCVVYPAERLADLMACFAKCKLALRRLRFVHPSPDAPANLVLAEGQKNSPGTRLSVMPPLTLADGAGNPLEEASEIVRRTGVP